MVNYPDSLAEAHQEILRLVDLLHQEQQKLVRSKQTIALLKRVPAALVEQLGPALITAMAASEGDRAARAEALRQQRDLPRLMEELMQRAEARHREALSDANSVEH